MANTLYGATLDLLHPGNMLRTEARPLLVARQLADAQTKPPPSNEEILVAAKAMYHAHSDTVDATARSGVQYAKSSEGHPRVAALNAYNWKSQQVAPISSTAEQVYAAPMMKPGVEAAAANPDIWTMVLGISESAQFLIGEEGGIGVAYALRAHPYDKGAAYLAGKVGFDVDLAFNLQVGLWNATPEGLAGTFWGLEVNAGVDGIGASLGIFMTPDIKFYGFAIGVGVGVGGGVTVVGGYTWVF